MAAAAAAGARASAELEAHIESAAAAAAAADVSEATVVEEAAASVREANERTARAEACLREVGVQTKLQL